MIAVYENVAGITAQMLDAAHKNDWDRLALLESACTEQIRILKQQNEAMPLNTEQRRQKMRVIQTILENDRQIRDITDPWMSRLSSLMQSNSFERKLVHAYGG